MTDRIADILVEDHVALMAENKRLREAAQAVLEAWGNCGVGVHPMLGTALRNLRDVLAEQDAEPVDDVWFEDNNGAMRKSPKDCQRFGANGAPAAVWVNGNRYPAQPSREWVGLTNEERRWVLDTTHPDNRWTLAERVEYRLKERNT